MMPTKRCPKCGRVLPIEEFAWRDSSHSRRQSWCKRDLARATSDGRKRQRAEARVR
jgi:hypothetical protein